MRLFCIILARNDIKTIQKVNKIKKNSNFEELFKKLDYKMEKIDKLDRQILEIISQNARIPFRDVAEKCGVSRAAIHQRVQRMIENEVIIGSGYHVNPKVLGFSTSAYIGVKLERGSMYKNAVPEFEKIPEVTECHFTTGPYTLLIKLYARDNDM